MTAAAPRICCLDLDTFFVSVERLHDPSLVGKPVIVGGRPGQRGVVTAASYEVRSYGVHSGMSLTEAARLAPHAVFVPTGHGRYGEYSEKVRAVAERYSPTVRMASIDEMYLDFSGCERMYRQAEDPSDDATILRAVGELTATIDRELGLPASAGIATSKPLAKVASGLAKPAGVLLVPRGDEAKLLGPLPVRKYPGIGPVAARRLSEAGIETMAGLAAAPESTVRRVFGAWSDYVREGARGRGPAQVGPNRPAFHEFDPRGYVAGSMSNERTFRSDVGDDAKIYATLSGLCERVCWRARKRGVKARAVTLKLRYADFHTITRSRTIALTDSELEVFPTVSALYRRAKTRRLPVRLLGVALSQLELGGRQMSLFDDHRRLHEAVDKIRCKFGYDMVHMARTKR